MHKNSDEIQNELELLDKDNTEVLMADLCETHEEYFDVLSEEERSVSPIVSQNSSTLMNNLGAKLNAASISSENGNFHWKWSISKSNC